jgi:hypothetical protein
MNSHDAHAGSRDLAALAGGLLAQERQGRHRYVRLADPDIAEMIEGLAAMAPTRMEPTHSLRAVSRQRAIARARTRANRNHRALIPSLLTCARQTGLV